MNPRTEALKITLWNTEWTKPGRLRGRRVAALLSESDPDVVCVTEGYPGILPSIGHTITGSADHGYGTTDGRRKVLLWSRAGWSDVETIGSSLMPTGRFACGVTDTGLGAMRFIAVCIPWLNAHVSTGRKDRRPWEDHLAFLDGLEEWLNRVPDDIPTVLLGDFNQRYPWAGQNQRAFDRLQQVLGERFEVVTGGVLPVVNSVSIDHVAVSSGLKAESVEAFSNLTDDGQQLSDHFGLRVRLAVH